MMRRFASMGALAFMCTVALTAAQTPAPGTANPPQTPNEPRTQAPAPTSSTGSVAQAGSQTLVGCLIREQDVPGRKPNVAERQGILEDYILTSAAPAASGSPAPTGTSGTAGPGAASSMSSMYKVEGIPDERLKTMVGKRVEVTGRVDQDDRREASPTGTAGAPPATPRTADDDMPEFEATSIREVPGTCPAAK